MNMIESAWAVTSFVSIIAIMFITGVCFAFFVRPYLKCKSAAIWSGTVYFVVMLILYIIPPAFNNFTAYSIGIIAAFVAMYVRDQRNAEQKIFLSVTFFSLRWLSIAMADKIDTALFNLIVMREAVAEKPWLQYGIYVCTRILNIGVSFLFITLSIYLLNKAFKYKSANISKKELLMLIMPSLSAMSGYAMLQFYQNIYERDTGKSLTSVYETYGFLSFIHYFISIISILVMVLVFQNIKARQEQSFGEKIIQSQIADMKKHIAEVEKLYRNIRLLRHDMGNHMQTIEHLINKNEKKDAAEYAAALRQEYQNISFGIKSGNPVTDVILTEKKKEAEERNIKFECSFYYPSDTNINSFDISIILNNALDNSLECTNGEKPYISISSYCKNNIFMIVVINSFDGSVVINEDTQLPVSIKNSAGHGLGLANIRRVAQKYLGDIVFEQENKKVILTVMLQFDLNKHQSSIANED